MLDIILIGRQGFKSKDQPTLLYLGDSRSEAKAVAQSADPKFVWVYEVNGTITRNHKTVRSKPAEAPVAAAPAPEPVKEFKKQSKSK
jgi:hypothetical protein